MEISSSGYGAHRTFYSRDQSLSKRTYNFSYELQQYYNKTQTLFNCIIEYMQPTTGLCDIKIKIIV